MPYARKYTWLDKGAKESGSQFHTLYKQHSFNKSRKDKNSLRLPYKRYIHSWRFGYVDLIDQTQQHTIVCPSGFTWGQGWGVLNKCWTGYKIAKNLEQSTENMTSFAKKIQNVQYDLGLKTSDFSHLGLPGDVLVLYDKPRSKAGLSSQASTEIEMKKEEEPAEEEINTEEYLKDLWLVDSIPAKTEQTE